MLRNGNNVIQFIVRLCRMLLAYRNTLESWNHPGLSNECKVSCSRKQRLNSKSVQISFISTEKTKSYISYFFTIVL